MDAADDDKGWEFWADRGGTFTDIVARGPRGELRTLKLLSQNPSAYADPIGEGVRRLLPDGDRLTAVRLGTTIATNALLTRSGSATALVVTAGHRDVLAIGNQQRPDLFALEIRRPEPLNECVIEAKERILASGAVDQALDVTALRNALAKAKANGIEAVAISFMHGHRYSQHEQAAAEVAQELCFTEIVCSHQVASLIRYVPRTTTALVDCYLARGLSRYIDALKASLQRYGDVSVSVMQSHGGLVHAAELRARNSLLSGPAGGVIGMQRGAAALGLRRVIGFDMGGTSTDVCCSDGAVALVDSATINGIEITAPHVDVHTIAAGGGSQLSVVDGRLNVGPESAGADPGPACYRNGGPATLTDANVVLGRIPIDRFPRQFGNDGRQGLDEKAATAALKALSAVVGDTQDIHVDHAALAADFIDVGVEQMANAIRKITLRRGLDPADFSLAVFGGAGGQHACAVADKLGIGSIWVHPLAGILSAWGMGAASHQRVQTKTLELAIADDLETIDAQADALLDATCRALSQPEGPSQLETELIAGLRVGHSEGIIELPLLPVATLAKRFSDLHAQRFGIEVQASQVVASFVRAKAQYRMNDSVKLPIAQTSTTSPTSVTDVYVEGQWRATPVLSTLDLGVDKQRQGPLIISDDHATLYVAPNWTVSRDQNAHLRLQRDQQQRSAVDGDGRSAHLIEVFNGRFRALAELMGQLLEQTAQSVNIRERLDYSCALFDEKGQLIANAPHMPVHLGSMGESVRNVIEGGCQAGEAWLLNSPYAGGTHLPDMTVVVPWASEGSTPNFYVAARAHHADVGGMAPASIPAHSRHIDEEGVLIDRFALLSDGRFQEAGLRTLLASGRWPCRNIDDNVADLAAQLAACREGARALDQLVAEFGLDLVTRYAVFVYENAAAAVRSALAKLKPGHASVTMDNQATIQVAIEIDHKRSRIAIDFTGTSAQTADNFNAPSAVTRAAVLYVLRCMVDHDIPLNEGCMAAVDLTIPVGSILDPAYPGAVVAGNVETSQCITDALLQALGQLAGSQGTMNNLTFGDATSQYYETIAGGAGAGPGFVGADAVQTHMTNSRLTDPEILEQRFPVVVDAFSIRPHSGGDGAFNGGDGACRRLRFLTPQTVSIVSNRRCQGASGLAGGGPGKPGRNRITAPGLNPVELEHVATIEAPAGSVLEILTPGGGGFGLSSVETHLDKIPESALSSSVSDATE